MIQKEKISGVKVVEYINSINMPTLNNLRRDRNKFIYNYKKSINIEFEIVRPKAETQFKVHKIKINDKDVFKKEEATSFRFIQQVKNPDIAFFPQHHNKEIDDIKEYFSENFINKKIEIINNPTSPIIILNKDNLSLEEYSLIQMEIVIARLKFIADNVDEKEDKWIINIPSSSSKKTKTSSTQSQSQKLEKDNNNNMENQALNQILYGPPGTGKTYNTINKAVEIIAPNDYNDGDTNEAYKANKAKFDELKNAGQIVFTTFHQNYTYEDFVIGIKPNIDSDKLTFKQNHGIFYKICEKARENYIKSNNIDKNTSVDFETKFQNLFNDLLEKDEPKKIKMKSGSEMEIYEITDTTIHFNKSNGTSKHTLSINTLQEYYIDRNRLGKNGLRPYYNAIIEAFPDIKAESQELLKNYVLIIDEINRANISRVFGELITLLEDDKRIGAEHELIITLPNGESFGVPKNLYIIGTMNTADKSIALIDIALRRRFHFEAKYPYSNLVKDDEKKTFLEKINKEIFKEKKSADWLIGHAYFMKNESLEVIVINKVIPLLMEYFNNNTETVEKILDNEYKYNDDGTYTWKKV